ncbi:MAG: hypothetical protein XD80_0331 [Synergistales bacterium 53_16]|nr:MAG: hypothetical protein XD80_0331 [Synergistales bacterium 53_16]
MTEFSRIRGVIAESESIKAGCVPVYYGKVREIGREGFRAFLPGERGGSIVTYEN